MTMFYKNQRSLFSNGNFPKGLFLLLGIMAVSSCANSERQSAEQDEPAAAQSQQAESVVYLPDLPDSVPEKTDKQPRRAKLPSPKDTTPKSRVDNRPASGSLPDFASIADSRERKQEFISFMKPVIQEENERIMEVRTDIKQLYVAHKLDHAIPQEQIDRLEKLAKHYRVKQRDFPSDEAFRALLLHVDIVPIELALAQAANESAWGTSYFARKGNNIFGKWCFSKGCGIVPRRRAEGSNHEVKVYQAVAGSVKDYLHHLNSHPAYRQLRVLRYEQRENGEKPDGYRVALGLQKYSAIGMKYVNILRSMIRNNADLMEV